MRIRQSLAWILAASTLCTVVLAAGDAPRQTRQRSVSVLVLGRGDAPVPDLGEQDFTVREDGALREVVRVAPAPPPTHLVLLADDSQAATSLLRELRSTLNTFVDTMAEQSPAPAIRLTTFGDRPTVVSDFSTSFSMVSRGIERVQPRPGSGARFLDALVETCRDLKTRKISNATLVAFVVEDGAEFSDARAKEVTEALRGVQAALWTIVLQDRRGNGAEGDASRERQTVIGDVTTQSGGRNAVVLTDQSLPQAYSRLATQLLSRYQVIYGRPEALIPPTRLEVTARDRSWKVQVSRWPAE